MVGRPRIPARKIAIANGDLTYIGSVCKYGHQDSRRYTKGGNCMMCQKGRDESYGNAYKKSPKWKAYQKQYQAVYRNDPANRKRLDEIQHKYYVKKYYNGDEQAYVLTQEARAERRKELDAIEAEVDLRRRLRQDK